MNSNSEPQQAGSVTDAQAVTRLDNIAEVAQQQARLLQEVRGRLEGVRIRLDGPAPDAINPANATADAPSPPGVLNQLTRTQEDVGEELQRCLQILERLEQLS